MAVSVCPPVPGVTLSPSQPISSVDNTTEVLPELHERALAEGGGKHHATGRGRASPTALPVHLVPDPQCHHPAPQQRHCADQLLPGEALCRAVLACGAAGGDGLSQGSALGARHWELSVLVPKAPRLSWLVRGRALEQQAAGCSQLLPFAAL